MALVLGIHNGHHASCALVRDGVLVAAIEQERVTRHKADGSQGLSNRLPVRECMQIASASFADVDLIVSSFQAIGPGGVGLSQPLIDPKFSLFDPFDKRHLVISHHYAHALSALGTSGLQDCAILVCDLAGSTTREGNDFTIPFANFIDDVTSLGARTNTLTECLSIYHANEHRLELCHREFCVPHSAPDVFVYSPASLYDNTARMIFDKENAHGELMALASMVSYTALSPRLNVEDIVEILAPGEVRFKNDWQYRVSLYDDQLKYAPFAAVVQEAFQRALLEYAKKTSILTHSAKLVASGGVFLNIAANSAIESSGLFEHFFVPSSPHDAGIAIGCAYHGWRSIASERGLVITSMTRKASDRIGTTYDEDKVNDALRSQSHLVLAECVVQPKDVAKLLQDGKIVARFAGPAEFGPRALGGRSLLATPLRNESKEKLNLIKRRQSWRPVAPIVLRERIAEFFIGPEESPYMNMLHKIADLHRDSLVALWHPDGSSRVQTLAEDDDAFLYETINQFGLLTGYPIVVNTSFNGPNEPIVETPEQALDFFCANDDVDRLLLGDLLVRRIANPPLQGIHLAPDVIVTIIHPGDTRRIILLRGRRSMEVTPETLHVMEHLSERDFDLTIMDVRVRQELSHALFLQFLVRT